MANIITREHAEIIAKKLGATRIEGKKASGGSREHVTAVIYHDGIEVASFGIRRGSNKELPHGHLTEDLHITPNQCRKLGDCSMQNTEWLEIMKEKGYLPEKEQTTETTRDESKPVMRRHGPRRKRKKD
jgi:hypothetical protein